MMQRAYHEKQRSLENQSFKYLDIFDRQMREHKQAQKEFYENQKEEDDEHDANKPAYFRKKKVAHQGNEPKSSDGKFDEAAVNEERPLSKKAEDAKAWANLQKQLDMDFDPETKSQDQLRDFFKLSKEGKNAVDHMNE